MIENIQKARSAIQAWRDIGLKHSTDNAAGVKWVLLVHVLGIVEAALDGETCAKGSDMRESNWRYVGMWAFPRDAYSRADGYALPASVVRAEISKRLGCDPGGMSIDVWRPVEAAVLEEYDLMIDRGLWVEPR